MYEVLDAAINLHLNDQDAIRGVERVRGTVKRNMRQIAREKAVIKIEGDLKGLKKDLKEATALVKAQQKVVDAQAKKQEGLSGAALASTKKKLKAEQDLLKQLKAQEEAKRAEVNYNEQNVRSLRERIKLTNIEAKQARQRVQAERDLGRIMKDNERTQTNRVKAQEASKKAVFDERAEVTKLQKAYDKQYQTLQKIRAEANKRTGRTGRLARAADPTITQRVKLAEADALAQMAKLHAELEAMGAEPVKIETTVERGKGFGALANLGNIGTRIGPFSGTLAQFTKAALGLGPVLMGLVGSIGALAGAIGGGLTGALGIAGAGLGAFGLSLGGVGALTVSLMRDFKNLNTLQDAYHKQVLKTGANSDKAKTKLAEFNHALGAVTPTTRESFLNLDKLIDRWRGLRKEVKPDFLNALGSTFDTINADFDVFSSHTVQAFKRVSRGWQEWMAALRSDEAKSVIGTLMHNANAAIPPLMRGLGDLIGALGKVGASFSRFLRPAIQDFADWTNKLNTAASNTDKLDKGTGRLYRSFRQTMDVVSAFSRVIIEFTRTAMGPGGKMMEDMAGGLNHIADAIAADRAGDNKLGKFLRDSVGTTEDLYHALVPLLKLFEQFTTVMRPWTDILLKVSGAFASLANNIAKTEVGSKALFALGTLWMFKRAPVTAVTLLAQGMNALSVAMLRVGKAGKFAAVGNALGAGGARLAASRAAGAGGAGAGAAVGSAAGGAGGGLLAGGLRALGGVGRGAMVAGAVRGGAAGALTQSVVRGLGGTLLSGVMRAGIWGTIGVGIFKGIKTGLDHGIRAGAQDALSSITFGLLPKHKDFEAIDRKITDDIDRIEALAQQRAEAKKLGINLDVNFKTDKATGSMKLLLAQIERTRQGMASSLRSAKSDLDMNMKAISTTMDIESAEGKQAVAANFRAVAAEIKRGIKSGAIDTDKGMKAIHGYLVQALTTLGLTKTGANLYLKHRDPLTGSKQGSKYTPKAVGGWIGMPGQKGTDQIPLLVGKGEAVLNRHQQAYVQAGLQAIGMPGGLNELFQKVRQPHYMATGGFTKAATGKLPSYRTHQRGMLGQVTQGNVDKYHTAAESKLKAALMQTQPGAGGGAKGERGPGGLGKFDGRMVANWIVPILNWARSHGWKGSITSGYRSHAYNVAQGRNYYSNHEGTAFPGGAIDVGGYGARAEGAALAAVLANYPGGSPLKWGGPIINDWGHFSATGHARGGFVGAARGRAPSTRGSVLSRILKRAPGLSVFNKNFKSNGGETLTPTVIRAIAEAAGFSPTEALHMMQISRGESSRQPGAVSKDGGYGLFQNTPRVWGPEAKAMLAKLGGPSAMLNPLLNAVMARFLFKDRQKQGKDPLGPWFGTKYLNRNSKAKGSVLPMFRTKGSYDATNAPRTHGPTMDLANLLALNEANVGRAGRTPNLADDIWATGVQIGGLQKQNKTSRQRIKTIDKALKGTLTSDQRTSLLSEREGLIGSIEQNKQSVFDKRKDARDKLFEYQRGKGNRRTDLDYKKSMAEATKKIDDDLAVAKEDAQYWTDRVAFLKKQHASRADITEAQNNLNSANQEVKTLSDQQVTDMEDAKRLTLQASQAQASLTSSLDDDLAVATSMQSWVQGMYDLAVATNDTAGIAKWGPELKSANDDVKSLNEQIAMEPLQMGQVMASLTADLNDDVAAAQSLVDYYQGIYDTATGADKIAAGGNLSGARSDLASAKRNAELLPLERNAALAALTDTLDDDKAATVALRDYWAAQLQNAKDNNDIPAQIEAAQNLKGLNDQIKDAEKSVMEQMIVLSEARRDLYKSFSNNLISQVPAGTLAPQPSSTYNGGTTVNVTNNFQTPPDDPHTWSQGVAWELQAAV